MAAALRLGAAGDGAAHHGRVPPRGRPVWRARPEREDERGDQPAVGARHDAVRLGGARHARRDPWRADRSRRRPVARRGRRLGADVRVRRLRDGGARVSERLCGALAARLDVVAPAHRRRPLQAAAVHVGHAQRARRRHAAAARRLAAQAGHRHGDAARARRGTARRAAPRSNAGPPPPPPPGRGAARG